MAWKARLNSTIVASGDQVIADFVFYDDAILDGGGQPVIQFSQSFAFSPTWSNADMQASVQARGQAFRAAKVRADALAAAFPPQTTVLTIP